MVTDLVDAFVSVGDSIYLYHELHGMLGAEGFTDFQLACHPNGSSAVEFGRTCAFRILPQQMYTQARQLKQSQEHKHDVLDPEIKQQLIVQAKREKAHNTSEIQTSAGRLLRYGKIMQLQHVASGKQLAVMHQASASHRDARRVVLCDDDDVGENTWFKIMPRLRVHTEGERVRSGDPVVFESVMSGLQLHTDGDGMLPDGRNEINASIEGSTYKMTIYRQSSHLNGDYVNGGDAIRILHREADGVLGTSIPRALLQEDMCVLPNATGEWRVA